MDGMADGLLSGTVQSFLGVAIGVITVIASTSFQHLQNRKVLKGEIYQRLELASNDLFRFELENRSSCTMLWDDNPQLLEDESIHFALVAYACQNLNLFEMAVRFRTDGTMPNEVFGSWVIWMSKLCRASNCQRLWPHLRYDYVPRLREIIDEGVRLHQHHSAEEATERFFELLGSKFNCREIRNWLNAN